MCILRWMLGANCMNYMNCIHIIHASVIFNSNCINLLPLSWASCASETWIWALWIYVDSRSSSPLFLKIYFFGPFLPSLAFANRYLIKKWTSSESGTNFFIFFSLVSLGLVLWNWQTQGVSCRLWCGIALFTFREFFGWRSARCGKKYQEMHMILSQPWK